MSLNLGGDGVITGCTSLSEPALTLSGLTVDTDTLVVDSTNNRVGIGTTSPSELLTVGDSGNTDSYISVESANNTEAGIKFYSDLTAAKGFNVGYEGNGNLFFIREDDSGTVTDRFVIDDAGNVGIGATPAVELDVNGEIRASTGVLFGTDTAAANTLDDYEEGTWTPVFRGGTTAGSYTYSTQVGKYTKIGNKVTVTATLLDITTSAAGTGIIEISGLPFAQTSDYSAGSVYMAHFDVDNNCVNITSRIDGNSSVIKILETRDALGGSASSVTDKTSDSAAIITTITYFTSA
jgi:hypothetical protein